MRRSKTATEATVQATGEIQEQFKEEDPRQALSTKSYAGCEQEILQVWALTDKRFKRYQDFLEEKAIKATVAVHQVIEDNKQESSEVPFRVGIFGKFRLIAFIRSIKHQNRTSTSGEIIEDRSEFQGIHRFLQEQLQQQFGPPDCDTLSQVLTRVFIYLESIVEVLII